MSKTVKRKTSARKKSARKAKPRKASSGKRDIVKDYPLPQFIAKIRRLADALEEGKRFNIQVAGRRIQVPGAARINVEHEVGDDAEELEFQLVWSPAESAGNKRSSK